MNSDKWVLIIVADVKMGSSISVHMQLLPCAHTTLEFIPRDYITVGAIRQTSVQCLLQVPVNADTVSLVICYGLHSATLFIQHSVKCFI